MSVSDIRKIRLKKAAAIKKAGFNVYPVRTKRTHCVGDVLLDFERLSRAKTEVILTGRIRAIREHGGSTFINIEDGSGCLQAYFKRDKLGEDRYKFFLDNFDVGDFIEVKGILFTTRKGEKTIETEKFHILAKSFLPLPEKWHGLKEIEERFRKRYLDLIMNPDVGEKFKLRSRIIEELRSSLNRQGFSEMETPILQPIPGGALARPFKTHLNALNLDLYLRVAPELYLKRLLVGGLEKIYEIGRCFRNEGIDKYHNPDFTMLELYWAYQDRDGLMNFVQELFIALLRAVKKESRIDFQGNIIDFKTPWEKIGFRALIKRHCGIDIETVSDAALMKSAQRHGLKIKKNTPRIKILDEIFKKVCQPTLIQPVFVIDYPLEMVVLAKANELKPKYADRFQMVVGGVELINGFSELNDPVEQRKRFKSKKMDIKRIDEDFLEALEYGMPPAAGLGMGIDRLVALLTNSSTLREVILFPAMKPRIISKTRVKAKKRNIRREECEKPKR